MRPAPLSIDRRSAIATIGGLAWSLGQPFARTAEAGVKQAQMSFGLVTYMWGADWDLSTLIAQCQKAKVGGVELRTTHKHGVEPALSPSERKDVARRFADSGVTLVGLGSNYRFDSPDPAMLAANIAGTKEFLQLSKDVGGSGVKVKPDDLPKDVAKEKTIAQIAAALVELGKFAADLGQEVRLEVHGKCAPLPIIKQIIDAADHKNVAVCWNSNAEDLAGDGLAHNFNLVRKRFGATLHVHELESPKYPYAELFKLLKESEYAGWVLLEAATKPGDRAAALAEQRALFDKLVA